jgi:hypothetical protein
VAKGLWLRRNEFLHEGIFLHPNKLILSAESYLWDFHQAQAGDNRTRDKVETTSQLRWMAPSPGWFKANWDAAIMKKEGRTGLGVVIRDHQGD